MKDRVILQSASPSESDSELCTATGLLVVGGLKSGQPGGTVASLSSLSAASSSRPSLSAERLPRSSAVWFNSRELFSPRPSSFLKQHFVGVLVLPVLGLWVCLWGVPPASCFCFKLALAGEAAW